MDDIKNKLLLPRYDTVFKSIFKDENNKDVVEDFLKAMLDIPDEVMFEDIIVQDPELLPDAEGEKLSILDVRLKVPGQGLVNVEMQLCRLPEIKQRIIHYLTKTGASQLSAGDDYADFKRVVMIVIADFNLIGDAEYYHRYLLYDKERDSLFTDLLEFVIVELRKRPVQSDRTARWSWARFFGSGSDAELREAAGESEKIAKAMLTIERLSADEAERVRAEYQEMMRRDYVSRINGAKREGRVEGLAEGRVEVAKRMKAEGMDAALISKVAGLPEDEIDKM
jgi:predicted transposase/invertase (TIGR01784 family)